MLTYPPRSRPPTEDSAPRYEASNLPDLLGMRLLGIYTAATVRRRLPRVARQDLLSCIDGKSSEAVGARRAVVQLLRHHLPLAELAGLLGVTDRTVRDLRRRPADPRLVQAIRLQLGLMQHRAQALQAQELPFENAS